MPAREGSGAERTPLRPLVFEPDLNGHRASYLRHLIQAVADLGLEATVVTTIDAQHHAGYRLHLRDLSHLARWDYRTAPLPRGPLAAARAKSRALLEAVRRHQPGHLFVPYGDGLSQVVSVRHRLGGWKMPPATESEALIFRVRSAYGGGGLPARTLGALYRALLCAAPWTRIHFQDPFAWQEATARCPGLSGRTGVMPEPIEEEPTVSRTEARRRLGLRQDGRYIVLAGQIDRRKGAHQLLHAFEAADLRPGDRLLVVGSWEDGLRRELHRQIREARMSDRLVIVDRYVSPEELTLALQAADVVAAPYIRHVGSASFVVRAAALGRPVLGPDFGWIGRTVRGFQLGWVCDVERSEALASTIRRSLDEAAGYTVSESARSFVKYHSVANFRAHWMAGLRQRLGLAPELSWPWARASEPLAS